MTTPARYSACHRFGLGAVIWTAAAVVASACAPAAPRPAATSAGPVPSPLVQQAPAQGQAPEQAASVELSTDIKIVASEFAFSPSTVQVPVDKEVTVTLENKGAIEHDAVVEMAGFHVVARGGQTAVAKFTFVKPGTYELICSIPGHKEAGMKGTLTVVGAGASAPPSNPPVEATAPAPKALPLGVRALPQPVVAPPTSRSAPAVVPIEIEAKEVTALVAEGVATTMWTFGGSVPGPLLRVRQGDTVEMTFKNAPDSTVTHSIDLHAVTGPGGGAKVTQVPPGEQATFSFRALNPGVYVYHCATPMVAHHIQSGMYGLIVVEPPEGFAPVDRELYVMQGELYLQGARGEQGVRDVSIDKLRAEQPDYVLFNGSVGALTGAGALQAKVGETVRIFFGVGGPNLISSFHVIGEIFDRLYPQGSSEAVHNVQTTLVPAGGATIVEFTAEVPGTYLLVDHSLSRLEKGASAQLVVEGSENPDVFRVVKSAGTNDGGH